jgi:hypothetical protein
VLSLRLFGFKLFFILEEIRTMTPLEFLQTHRDTLNLAGISRQAGYSSGYLKHVLARRRLFTPSAQRKIKAVIIDLIEAGKAVQDA